MTEACKAIIEHCYKNGVAVSIRPIIGDKYNLGNITFKFTEELLAELSASGRVKIGTRIGDSVRISGI
jgi:hypothetical protein